MLMMIRAFTLEIIDSFGKYGGIKIRKMFIPQFLFTGMAKVGDAIKLPFNSNTLGKLPKVGLFLMIK
jgi:hypothetical protein